MASMCARILAISSEGSLIVQDCQVAGALSCRWPRARTGKLRGVSKFLNDVEKSLTTSGSRWKIGVDSDCPLLSPLIGAPHAEMHEGRPVHT